MKYSNALVKKLCEILATGNYTIADSCKQVGISEGAYYKWKRSKPEFVTALEDAEASRLASHREMAISGLAKLLDVHEYVEVTTEYENDKKTGKPLIKSQKHVHKKVMPNATAIIFTLTNRDSENWKNRQDHTTKGEKIQASLFMQVIMESSRKETEEEIPNTSNPT